MHRSRHAVPIAAALAVLAAGCAGDPEPRSAPPRTADATSSASPSASPSSPTAQQTPSVSATSSTTRTPSPAPTGPSANARPVVAGTLATGLEAPWGLAFQPDGSALVSERDSGRIVRVGDGEVLPVGTVEGVDAGGEGGLLGIAVAPTFEQDRLVYAYYTAEDDNRVVAMRYDGRDLGEQRVILDGIAKSGIHNGGRIAFGPDGYLYVATGDAGDPQSSQDRDSLNGKILRITPQGRPAPGNPFDNSPVWSLGHRNVQGLAWDAQGRLWASEFGQNTYDELNLIEKGRNYGWPLVEGRGGDDRFAEPRVVWSPAEASPSGIAVAGGAVYVAGLRGSRLWQVPTTGGREPRDFFADEYGRLRTVATAPDGSLWLVTNNTDGRGDAREGDDRILRIRLRD